jgi:hypothetical protein
MKAESRLATCPGALPGVDGRPRLMRGESRLRGTDGGDER